ncbi:MAG: primosomal protein N' [Verrucomicrobiales bacterium]|nr:primosomal protein N' [Verrucomicrobiales bacterium]
MPNIARVLIDGAASDLQFDYAVPDDWAGRVFPGCRVRIPLRNRPATGTVMAVLEEPDAGATWLAKLKPLQSLIDEEPVLTPPLFALADWIADYYLTPREAVLRSMIPQAARSGEGTEKTRKLVTLLSEPDAEALAALRKRSKRQAELVDHLAAQTGRHAFLTELTGKDLGFSRQVITALEKAGLVSVADGAVARDPFASETYLASGPLELNAEQRTALDAVIQAIESPDDAGRKPILLHGVTGSGKTEVYLQAIQHVIDRGQGAIVLVPEISLTPQTADRFKQRFAAIQREVAVLHSHLSSGERHDEWRKVLRREARIVIGARSAIFAPIRDLGLIVVDEEHENSYKQETQPRYHGRDLAVVRAHLEKCAVLLGSATPSLESWRNVQSGKYRLTELRGRIDDRTLPLIRVIDMRLETRKQGGGLAILSSKLREAIDARLAESEQIILFLNRRGFARSLQCPECGHVAECPHCSLALTYHKEDDRLICHLCGYARVAPQRCPECSSRGITLAGYGTEKVESVLRQVFDKARIARVDTDTMRKKNQLSDTLKAFKARKIDILVGTQMIAKGLHFPNVTLVGVLNADIGLHVPDFRASERTFQLLTQVAGRAGRGDVAGEVIVQTFTPHAPSIQFARHHDYEGFAAQELILRDQFQFPPALHLAVVTVRSVHKERAEFSLQTLHRRLKRHLPPGIELTEPLPSPLVRSHDQWRFQVTMKSPSARRLARHLRETLAGLTFPEDVLVTIDMDAYSLS